MSANLHSHLLTGLAMKECKRCKGAGAQAPLPGERLMEKVCWICRGKGKLPPIDELAIRGLILTRTGKLKPDRPKVPYKVAMSLIGKPGLFVPQTIEDAQLVWRGSVEGRRAHYVWKVLKGIARTTPDVLGTKKFDPYRDELVQLAEKIKGELDAS